MMWALVVMVCQVPVVPESCSYPRERQAVFSTEKDCRDSITRQLRPIQFGWKVIGPRNRIYMDCNPVRG